jgi:hypothetical protein
MTASEGAVMSLAFGEMVAEPFTRPAPALATRARCVASAAHLVGPTDRLHGAVLWFWTVSHVVSGRMKFPNDRRRRRAREAAEFR